MANQQKDPGRQWNKKKALGRKRAHHRVKIAPPPQWIEAKLADLPESSRVRLLYDANDFDALGQGPVGLSNLVRLTNPLLPLPQPEWRQFGFTVLSKKGIVVPDLGMLVSARWQFALEWKRSRSAWDALLFSLEHLHLRAFSLPPTYLIPALFVVCMADRPDDDLLNMTIAAWGPVLHETCQMLAPLLQALYACWIDGPSKTAFRYRQFIEYLPREEADYWQCIDPLSRIIGPENLETIRGSEHLEATIIRQLLQASIQLWTKECPSFPKQDLLTILSRSRLRALLSLALWSPSFPAKPEADITHLHSLEDVFHLWKQQRTME